MRPEALNYVCFVLQCAVGTWRYLDNHLMEGQLVAFLASSVALQLPLNLLFGMGAMPSQAESQPNSARGIVKHPDHHAGPCTRSEPDFALARQRFALSSLICLQPFWPTDFKNVSLTIPFGRRVAFVGPSGSGKTTLAKLFLHLYDPDEGSVPPEMSICDRPVPSRCGGALGVVPQVPFFFVTAVRENLLIMRSDAKHADCQRKCELANAWEFIRGWPEGLGDPIGEGGI
jgi:ABC-type bacteriocin/lantibiotic exporter with double-glycine peptidase domain